MGLLDIVKSVVNPVINKVTSIPVLGQLIKGTPQVATYEVATGQSTLSQAAINYGVTTGTGAVAAVSALNPTLALNTVKAIDKNILKVVGYGTAGVVGAGVLSTSSKPLEIPAKATGELFSTGADLGDVMEGKKDLIDVVKAHPYTASAVGLITAVGLGVGTKSLISSASNLYTASKVKDAAESISLPSTTTGYMNPTQTSSNLPTEGQIKEQGQQKVKEIEATTKSKKELSELEYKQQVELKQKEYEAQKEAAEKQRDELNSLKSALENDINKQQKDLEAILPSHGSISGKAASRAAPIQKVIAAEQQQLLQVNAALGGLIMPVAPTIEPYVPPKKKVTKKKAKKKPKNKPKKRKINKSKKKKGK